MNRHQSNPFLSDWDTNDDVQPQSTGIFDLDPPTQSNDSTRQIDSSRRHSSSGNTQHPDRRLYHRNMSSFEVASYQLEHQKQMQDDRSDNLDIDQTELIAKMTADFKSVIETNDKNSLIIDCEAFSSTDLNPFDPFKTITDDDVSLPSSATGLNQVQKTENSLGIYDSERPNDINLDRSQQRNMHDSIDDDEDELVSTPVRNIKSSAQITSNEAYNDSKSGSCLTSLDRASIDTTIPNFKTTDDIKDQPMSQEDLASSNSIAKASLFASLLASAESSGQTGSNPPSVDEMADINSIENEPVRLSSGEFTTHIIKATHSTTDGNFDRPVGFFDPFETVIDKDALTSLMNDNQYMTRNERANDEVCSSQPDQLLDNSSSTSEILTDEKANADCVTRMDNGNNVDPDHVSKTITENLSNKEQHSEYVSTEATEPTDPSLEHSSYKNNEKLDNKALPRPVRSNVKLDEHSSSSTQATEHSSRSQVQTKKASKSKKSSFQEDSSDSSDDDRIQIVIKARDTNKVESQSGPVLVPLLPPPPSKSSMKQARERGQVDDMPSPVMSYKTRHDKRVDSFEDLSDHESKENLNQRDESQAKEVDEEDDQDQDDGQFVIPMTHSDEESDTYGKPDTPLYDEDTSYVLEEYPAKYEGPGWDMMLRYPPKKKLTSNRFWKKIFVKLAQVPLVPDSKSSKQQLDNEPAQTCIALQIFDKADDKKPMQEIPIQATYTVSEISSQQLDQFGKIFTIKLQYIFYKERVGVRQGQLARFIHSGHIGSSTTSGGHGVDPISIGAIKRIGAPIEHSPQVSQIIKLGCSSYNDIRQFKNCLEDYLFKMSIHRDRALTSYKTEEVQMAVRDETYIELNQVGTIIKQMARVRLFFLSFLNGMPTVEVGINDIHRQGREVVGRMDILPVVTEEWIRLEAWELHSTVEKEEFENPNSRIIKLIPPDATFFELMRFRVRPPRNRELPLQVSANMSVTRTKVSINCEVMVPGCVSRKHGQIPCEDIAIKVSIPECWIYFFREEKHFRMGSKKSVNRRPGKVKGIERFLGGGGLQDINDESSLIEVTSGQAKYEHHHNAIVWRAARWPKESQSAYVQNTMKIRLPLTAFDKMPENYNEYVHVEYTMPATTVSHTTLRSISVNPVDDEAPEKYVKYSAKYEYKVKMRLSVNQGSKGNDVQAETSPIVILKQPDLQDDLQREEDSDDDDDDVDSSEH